MGMERKIVKFETFEAQELYFLPMITHFHRWNDSGLWLPCKAKEVSNLSNLKKNHHRQRSFE
jgi:hypothetical protein